jgi:hypothetical protein
MNTTQKNTRLELTQQFIDNQLNYYESDDFKNNYLDCLFEDKSNVEYQIKEVCRREFNINALTNLQAEQIYTYMLENLEDYVSEFNNYWVGAYSIDSVEFGEQETELPENFLPVISELKNEFTLNRKYLYYNLGGKGLHVSLTKQVIETVLNIEITE